MFKRSKPMIGEELEILKRTYKRLLKNTNNINTYNTMSETKLNKKTEISIDKRPYSFKEYYAGTIIIKKDILRFTLIISDEYENVIWDDKRPKSHREIELDIIKQFQKR